MSDTNLQLLSRYTRHHAEEAFAELVRRHVDLIHSAALRQVRSSQLAEEVAQSVFLDLAHQAKHLAPDTILTAWLYEVTRRTAIDVVRREARRQLREQIATEMNAMNATAADWTHIEPLLDEAMHALDATDRAAVLLRYFENKSLREVGAALGTSDDAAQKRVSRAVERLREYFNKHGVSVGASGLAVVLLANAVQAAPVGLALTISTAAALTGTAIVTTATTTATNAIAMTTMQKTLIAAALTVAVGAGIFETHRASVLREEAKTLRQQQTLAAQQIQRLESERDDALRQLASLRASNERLSLNSAELLKLRGQVGMLRQELADAKQRLESTATTTNIVPGSWAIGETKWRTNWTSVGTASPEAALLTYWWAVANRNVEGVKNSTISFSDKPVSDEDAKEAIREDGTQTYFDSFGGLRLRSLKLSRDSATVEVAKLNRVIAKGGITIPPTELPEWGESPSQTFELMSVYNDWRIVRHENHKNRIRISFDDPDIEHVARMLITIPPEAVEKLKHRIPPATLRAYEELKARAAK